jgi:hypothetical protein
MKTILLAIFLAGILLSIPSLSATQFNRDTEENSQLTLLRHLFDKNDQQKLLILIIGAIIYYTIVISYFLTH